MMGVKMCVKMCSAVYPQRISNNAGKQFLTGIYAREILEVIAIFSRDYSKLISMFYRFWVLIIWVPKLKVCVN